MSRKGESAGQWPRPSARTDRDGENSRPQSSEADAVICIVFVMTFLVFSIVEYIHREWIGVAVHAMMFITISLGGCELLLAAILKQQNRGGFDALFSSWTVALAVLLALSGWAVRWGAWSLH